MNLVGKALGQRYTPQSCRRGMTEVCIAVKHDTEVRAAVDYTTVYSPGGAGNSNTVIRPQYLWPTHPSFGKSQLSPVSHGESDAVQPCGNVGHFLSVCAEAGALLLPTQWCEQVRRQEACAGPEHDSVRDESAQIARIWC